MKLALPGWVASGAVGDTLALAAADPLLCAGCDVRTTTHIYDVHDYKPGLYTMMMTEGGLYISVDDVVEVRPAVVLYITATSGSSD